MCGIVGVLARTDSLRADLGRLVTPMLDCMGTRGPDSAGLAVFSEPIPSDLRRYVLYNGTPGSSDDPHVRWSELQSAYQRDIDANSTFAEQANHCVVQSSTAVDETREWLGREFPSTHLLSVGRAICMFKDEGHPREIADRLQFTELNGSHAVGHTRMATESAVSPAHAHPYTAGEDFCLVHNGSLSNHHTIRRDLERRGIRFETDNDTEAGCRFLEWRLREGDSLEAAIQESFSVLDGFFTFLMATADRLVLVRDACSCKPAVVAESDDYVAIASEFRSLAHLPGIEAAHVFEPMPEQIYSWTV